MSLKEWYEASCERKFRERMVEVYIQYLKEEADKYVAQFNRDDIADKYYEGLCKGMDFIIDLIESKPKLTEAQSKWI